MYLRFDMGSHPRVVDWIFLVFLVGIGVRSKGWNGKSFDEIVFFMCFRSRFPGLIVGLLSAFEWT